jgi:peptidylprolyl isomerase
VFATSCKNEISTNLHSLEINTGKYEIIIDNKGKKATPGDYIIYSVLFKDNKGKVFMDKREEGKLLREQVLIDSAFIKDLTAASEVLYKLSKGDSAIVYVPLEDEQKEGSLRNSDTLLFYLKVENIVNKEGMRDLIEDEYLKQEAEQNEARIKQIEVDQIIMKTWDEYNKGKLQDKLKTSKKGIKYFIVKNGNGSNAKYGQKVNVGYFGMTHENAVAFDNTFRRNKDLTLVIGSNKIIAGWNEALLEMNQGMRAVFFIPSSLAYGKDGKTPMIQPNSDLVFYIELHEIIK